MTQTQWTTTKLLDWMVGYLDKAGVESARLRSEMILSHVLGLQRIMLYISTPVAPDKLATLKELVREAASHKPVEYIIGYTTFYSITIKVSSDTLIPRPETEDLVRYAVDTLRGSDSKKVLDLCSGSGCIAAAVAKNVADCQVAAADISQGALEVAAENFRQCGVEDRVRVVQGDLFEPLAGEQFDLIISNPPYVTTGEYAELDKNVRDYEPSLALLAGDDGLDFYKEIIKQSPEYLTDGGKLLLEIGYQQAGAVKKLLEENGNFKDILVYKDFANNDRVVSAVKS
ncbi:MAG: peptide chain release factor N(5)-glutamine methyltransferase [Sedimentisphaeraceae bacterium JB056]